MVNPTASGFGAGACKSPQNAARSRARLLQPDAKADSEIFNKFGPASAAAGIPMRNRDFISNGFLALVAAGLLLLFSSLVAIALI
jgi:hypothetical protein